MNIEMKNNIKNYRSFRDFCESRRRRFKEKDTSSYYDYSYYDKDGNKVDVYKFKIDVCYSAPPIPKVEKNPIDVPKAVYSNLDSAPGSSVDIFSSNSDDHKSRLDRLFSLSGLVYRYNRGLFIVNPEGKYVEDIFDGTSKHHASQLSRIANDEFQVNVPFLGTTGDMDESLIATQNGLAVMLLEGNMCQVYLPENITNQMITELIRMIEPRKDFIFYVARGEKISDELVSDQLIDYLNSLYVNDDVVENSNVNESYFNQLHTYLQQRNISVYEYFVEIGHMYRNGRVDSIPEFERKSPFLSENDIKLLLDSKDSEIVFHFARAMERVIRLNVSSTDNRTDTNISNQTDSKESSTNQVNSNLNVGNDYLEQLHHYLIQHRITVYEYFVEIGHMYRNGRIDSIPEFERKSPFLNENDIRLLLDSKDPEIVFHFARAMERVIRLNVSNLRNNNNQIQSNSSNNNSSKPNDQNSSSVSSTNKPSIHITSINTDLLENLNGFAIIREKKLGRTNIYQYNRDNKDVLLNRKIKNTVIRAHSGYYVNFLEAIQLLLGDYSHEDISFVNENNDVLSYDVVVEGALQVCRQSGAIRYGRDNANITINNRDDLSKMNNDQTNLNGISMIKGLYVRRDVLMEFFNKLKIRRQYHSDNNKVYTK